VVIDGAAGKVGFARANPETWNPMTDPMMDLKSLLEKTPDANGLREMIYFSGDKLMELEVGQLTGSGYSEKSPERLAHRNGRPAPARSSCAFRSCARVRTFPAFWSRAGWPRRRSPLLTTSSSQVHAGGREFGCDGSRHGARARGECGKPEIIVFTLRREHGAWKIDDIADPAMPSIRTYFYGS
jgi:hypothetical protein